MPKSKKKLPRGYEVAGFYDPKTRAILVKGDYPYDTDEKKQKITKRRGPR